MDPPWDFSLSSTARTISCNGKDRCVIQQSYTEGSMWTAYQVIDRLFVGGLGYDTSGSLFSFDCLCV